MSHEQSSVQLRVPFAASSASIARQRLREWMAEQDSAPDRIDVARVVVSELVANSIRHARPLADGNIALAWCTRGHQLVVSVTDGGAPTVPRTVSASPTAMAGRGMAIVDALAERWWAEQNRSTATVHACLSVA